MKRCAGRSGGEGRVSLHPERQMGKPGDVLEGGAKHPAVAKSRSGIKNQIVRNREMREPSGLSSEGHSMGHDDLPGYTMTTLDLLPEALLVTDLAGTILWANRRAEEITGWAIDALRGIRLQRLISMDQVREIARARGLADPLALQRYHCFLRTKSGERREVSVSVSPVTDSGAPARIYLLRDIRMQREMDYRLWAQLAEKQEAEAFGLVASVVVHDLRNLNNLMSITVRNFRRYLDDMAFRQDAIRTLEDVTSKMRYLMEKLSGSLKQTGLHRQATNLGELIHNVLDLVAKSGRGRQVVATEVRGFDQPLLCEVDVSELERVIFNLLLNAYEAAEVGGQVSIAGAEQPNRGSVCLVIEDTGPGISQTYMESFLFRPFRSTKPRGFGVGLYQAKCIVEAHGGTIDVSNRGEGSGTRVTITLPAATVRDQNLPLFPVERAHA